MLRQKSIFVTKTYETLALFFNIAISIVFVLFLPDKLERRSKFYYVSAVSLIPRLKKSPI